MYYVYIVYMYMCIRMLDTRILYGGVTHYIHLCVYARGCRLLLANRRDQGYFLIYRKLWTCQYSLVYTVMLIYLIKLRSNDANNNILESSFLQFKHCLVLSIVCIGYFHVVLQLLMHFLFDNSNFLRFILFRAYSLQRRFNFLSPSNYSQYQNVDF